MKVIFYNLDFEKEFEIEDYIIFEIENRVLFQKCVCNLYGCETDIKDIAIIDKNKILEREKDYAMLIDYFRHEYYTKPCLTKLYKNIEQHYANDMEVAQKVSSINNKINDFVKYLLNDYDGDFAVDDIFSIETLLKFVSLKPQTSEGLSYNNIINYISLSNILGVNNLMVFVNAQSFFNQNEIEEIVKIASHKKIKLFFLENKFYTNHLKNKVKIDNDYFVQKC